jgi:curved DNA-binding protein CbpA
MRFDSIHDDYYQRLGVSPEADLREIEAAYWAFARELRGQAAMAPYNEAYEALASSERRRAYDAKRDAQKPAAEAPQAPTPPPAPSKFGWSAHQ